MTTTTYAEAVLDEACRTFWLAAQADMAGTRAKLAMSIARMTREMIADDCGDWATVDVHRATAHGRRIVADARYDARMVGPGLGLIVVALPDGRKYVRHEPYAPPADVTWRSVREYGRWQGWSEIRVRADGTILCHGDHTDIPDIIADWADGVSGYLIADPAGVSAGWRERYGAIPLAGYSDRRPGDPQGQCLD